MKQMKKMAILTLVFGLVLAAAGCGSSGYKEGTYEGTNKTAMLTVKVSAVVKDGKISEVKVTNEDEMEGPGLEAAANMPGKIVEAQSTEVETVSGATITSNGIIEATKQALEEAK
ncbi:MAG: FMN-binding protein [Eubacteriaceae bacterium]|nr:FMN-binding protein [Eubacteriaceae bacterium]